MIVKCKVCRREIVVNENDYNPGKKITIECERCGNEIDVTIPEREEKKVLKKTEPVVTPVPESSEKIRENTNPIQTNDETEQASAPSQSEHVVTSNHTDYSDVFAPSVASVASVSDYSAAADTGKKKKKMYIVIPVLILLFVGVFGWFYYQNVYLPEKIDREAPRTYPIVNLNLRSSKMAGSDYNKLTSVPYGGELITYNIDDEWADVKYVKPDGSESTKGYAAAPYLVDKKDFYLLNSIFGDNEAREILATSKVRRALLDYYKEKGYVGNLSTDLMDEVGLTAGNDSKWQVFFPRGEQKPNEVVFKRLINPNSKYTDMALLIKNINSGDRKLLYFYFDDDETPHFVGEMDAPQEGTLKDVINQYGDITPIFAN